MLLFEIIQKILFFLGGSFIFFILAFLLINTNKKLKDVNKKFDYIMYSTMALVLIFSLFLLGASWYLPLLVLASGYYVYKIFN